MLLVDDDEATNFLHKRAIRRSGKEIHVLEATNGVDALVKLKEAYQQGDAPPQYIFLDINMPVLDGWGFLDQFRELPEAWRKHVKLFMLTTSLNPDDHERAHAYEEVTAVCDKMLNAEQFSKIFNA